MAGSRLLPINVALLTTAELRQISHGLAESGLSWALRPHKWVSPSAQVTAVRRRLRRVSRCIRGSRSQLGERPDLT
jgi:hypothetical protein